MSVFAVSGIIFALMLAGIGLLSGARSDPETANRKGSAEQAGSKMLLVAAAVTVLSAIVLGIWVAAWLAARARSDWREVMLGGLIGLTFSLLTVAFPLAGRLYRWATVKRLSSVEKPVMLPLTYWLTECGAVTLVCGLIGAIARFRSSGPDLVVLLPVAVALPPLFRALIGPLFMRKQMRNLITERHDSASDEVSQLQQWIDQLATRYALKTSPPLIPIAGKKAFAAEALRPEAAIFISSELLNAMTPDERKGLVAHEFAHIVRRERLRRALPLAVVTVWYIGLYAWWITQHPATTLANRLVWLIAYSYVMQAVRTALSRRSEFAADKLAAEMVGDARPVVGALQKIARVWRLPMDRATRTHPSTAARIAALGDAR
jgi:Zn-dependent protease with chaperone function